MARIPDCIPYSSGHKAVKQDPKESDIPADSRWVFSMISPLNWDICECDGDIVDGFAGTTEII